MSARKLGRFVGLVFVLAVLTGGSAASVSAEHASGGSTPAAVQLFLGDIDWD
ncbi:hypothetical protein AB0368_11730 [Actinoplanes sp. NPDC051475]|uniref:hypothetical protein n=1 Tax=Actinoplanes sp. NPDC051475 TaxID=3157225 RepID=UPI00344D8B87